MSYELKTCPFCAPQWQPIETAPSDVEVLMFCPTRHVSNMERVEVGVYHNTKGGTYNQWATHWMPLPEPPKVKP